MNRIRVLLIFTVSWLFFITNLETIVSETTLSFLYIHPIVFIMVIGTLLFALGLPETNELPGNVQLMGLLSVYGLTLLVFPRGEMVLEAAILHAAFEISVVVVSFVLCHRLSAWFLNYNSRLQEAALSTIDSVIASTFSDLEAIEKKISRARRFEHELSIVHVDLADAMRLSNLSRTTSRRLLSSHLAEMMQMVTSKATTKSWYNNNLVLCIPANVESSQVKSTIENMKAVLRDVMKIQADITTASFPQDGLVLSDLVENATYGHQQQTDEKRTVLYPMPQQRQLKTQMSS